jgi:hypothetical protein
MVTDQPLTDHRLLIDWKRMKVDNDLPLLLILNDRGDGSGLCRRRQK